MLSGDKLQNLQVGKEEKKEKYKCPLCGMEHVWFINGLIEDKINNKFIKQKDAGYAFCNCRNIFFTKWENIKQTEYNENYFDKYNNELSKDVMQRMYQLYENKFKEFNPTAKEFFEIGCINGEILKSAKKSGYNVEGLDINPYTKSQEFKIINGDIEKEETINKLKTYDIIWATHVFEHFKNPLKVANDLFLKLNNNGLLFIAMPDPFFINWSNPYTWAHWHIKEHHILWDMDSFIDALLEIGYELKHNSRHVGLEWYTSSGDFNIIFQKKGV